jgi:putative ABC transport system permease protein
VSKVRSLGRRIAELWRKQQRDRELQEELAAIAEMEAARGVSSGLTPAMAPRTARIRMEMENTKETVRDHRGLPLLETFLQDVRLALRMLRKNPGFAAVALLTVALGIGANTAMFSAVNAVLLRKLPLRDPDRLMMLWESNPVLEGLLSERLPVRMRTYLYWKEHNRSFDDLAITTEDSVNVSGGQTPVHVVRFKISSNFFGVLGLRPALGREFSHDETNGPEPKLAMLSYGLYERQFGKAGDILDRKIRLDGVDHQIIGVLPRDFELPAEWGGLDQPKPGVFTPLNVSPAQSSAELREDQLNQNIHTVYGRLKPGVTLAAARADIRLLESQLVQQFPKEYEKFSANVFSIYDEDVSGDMRTSLLALQLAVGFVLLIACVNVANLLLARAAGREKEISVRLALGASRGRLVRQMLSESFVFSLLGACLGLALAWGGMRGLAKLAPGDVHGLQEMKLDLPVLGFTLLATLVAAVLFGLVPALHAARQKLQTSLHERMSRGGREAKTGMSRKLRDALVVAEIALALAPLAGAGLMIRTLHALNALDLGIQPERVIDGTVNLPTAQYKAAEQRRAFCDQLLEKVRALPQVESAALVGGPPLQSIGIVNISLEGDAPDQNRTADIELASDDYFRTMGSPLIEGRSFTTQEAESDAHVLVISRGLARRLWPGQDPISKVIVVGQKKDRYSVIGVVPDTRILALGTDARQTAYRPSRTLGGLTLVVRSRTSIASLGPALEQQLHSLDPDLPIYRLQPLTDVARGNVAQQRFTMVLLIAFAALALVLAAIGLYGVLAYAVAQRTHEIGIRMAMGARAADVIGMVLRQGLLSVMVGVLIGIAGSLALLRAMKSLLFGVKAHDPLTFAAVTALLIAVTLMASYLPARRAAKVDPTVALRDE